MRRAKSACAAIKSSLVCNQDRPTQPLWDHPGHETHSRNTACRFERASLVTPRGQLPALTSFPESLVARGHQSAHLPFVGQRGSEDKSHGSTGGSLVTLPSLPPLCVPLLSVSNFGVRSGRQTTHKQLKIERPQSPELQLPTRPVLHSGGGCDWLVTAIESHYPAKCIFYEITFYSPHVASRGPVPSCFLMRLFGKSR